MSIQEAALYGGHWRWLSATHAAARLALASSGLDVATARAQLDEFIRDWLFTPQTLYGSAPREIIWRELLGEGNPLPRQYAVEAYGDCDCPICQMLARRSRAPKSDEAHGHCWTYAPESGLIDRYDPEGSEERWRKELAGMTQA